MTKPVEPKRDDAPETDAKRFEKTMRRVLSVSKDELNQREAEYKKHRKAERADRIPPPITDPTTRTP